MFDTPEKIQAAIASGELDAEVGALMLKRLPGASLDLDRYSQGLSDQGRAMQQNFLTRDVQGATTLNTEYQYPGTTYPGLETLPPLSLGNTSQNNVPLENNPLVSNSQPQIQKGSEEQIADLMSQGFTRNEAEQLAKSKNYDITGRNTGDSYSSDYEEYLKSNPQANGQLDLSKGFPYIYGGGTDLNTRANLLGQFAGLQKGTEGKGLGIGLSAASLALGLAGDVASGIGMSRANKVAQDYYQKKLRGVDVNDYINAPQDRNTNGTGNMNFRGGGLFLFEDGGTMPASPVEQMVLKAIQDGVPPESIIQSLVAQGISQEQAAQVINSVTEQTTQQPQVGEQPDSDIPVEKLLTGEVMKGLGKDSLIKPNAEVEKEEALKFPDGTVQKVDGADHEEGGVKVNIPSGTKILSDTNKITKANVKYLVKNFDLKVSTDDTYASVLEKYSKKIGLGKLNSEQEEVFKLLKKQMENENVPEGTVRVNTDFLAKKIKAIEDKKAPKEADKQKFFDTLFSFQESEKKPTNKEGEFRQGGEFEAVCKKMGIDPEHAKSIMGIVPKYPEGGTFKTLSKGFEDGTIKPEDLKQQIDQAYKEGKLDLGEYVELGKKIPGNIAPVVKSGVYTGTYNTTTLAGQGAEQYRVNQRQIGESGVYGLEKTNEEIVTQLAKNFPDIIFDDKVFGKYIDKEKSKNGQVVLKPNTKIADSSVLEMQKRVDTRMKATADDILANKDKFDQATIDRAKQYRDTETFTGETSKNMSTKEKVQSFDSRLGNFTSSRYSIGLNLVNPDESKVLSAKGINTLNQIDDETLKTLSPETQAKVKDLRSTKSTGSDFSLNTYTPTVIPTAEEVKTLPVSTDSTVTDLVKNMPATKYPKMFYHPAQVQMAPTPLTATYMGDIQTQYIDPTRIGIENNLQAISDQNQMIAGQLDNLPPSQRAAALSSLLATSQQSTNQAITNANTVNAQAQQQAEVFNIGQFDRNQQNNFNIKQHYTDKTEQAQALLEENMRNYFNFNQKVALTNRASDDKMNLLASVYDYAPNFYGNQIQFDPNDPWSVQKRNDFLANYPQANVPNP